MKRKNRVTRVTLASSNVCSNFSERRPGVARRPERVPEVQPQRSLADRGREVAGWVRERPLNVLFLGVAALVVLTVGYRLWRSRYQDLPRIAELGRTEGLTALDEGRFDEAHQLLSAARRAVQSLGGAFEGAEVVVHLSGLGQVPGMVAALEEAGVRRGVFVSSAGVRTRLESQSADAKRAGEEALRCSSIGYTILRPSMIYGTPGDRNLARLLRWLRAFPVVPVPGGGATLQQPVHVDDLVAAITGALERPETERKEYDVGGPEAFSLRELVHACAASVGRRAFVIGVPLGPAHGVAALLQRLGFRSPVRPEQILRLTESKAVDISAARRDLDFDPRSFADGIRAEAKLLPPR